MALRIGELPFSVQLLICLGVAVGVVGAGEYLGVSPVKAARDELIIKQNQKAKLDTEVHELEVIKQQYAEFQAKEESLKATLASMALLVPSAKQTDDFIRLLQSSATGAQVSLRRLTSRPVVFKDFYTEMPFEVEMDGPYYNMLEFFRRLGNTTRIINAGTLKLQGIDPAKGNYDYLPNTSVSGTLTVTTYYRPSEAEIEATAPAAKPPAKPAAK